MLPVNVEVVTIGDELILGHIRDTNAAVLSEALVGLGLPVARHTTVGDKPERIAQVVEEALNRVNMVITTGGLGPTKDDLTKNVIAELFGLQLVLDEVYLADLKRKFARLGMSPMPESNRSQALVPEGAEVIPNPRGSAPGLWIKDDADHVIMLPGVPHEVEGILREELVPRLRERFRVHSEITRTRTLRTVGIGESALADRLEGIEERLGMLSLAYLPGFFGVDLRLTASLIDRDEIDGMLAEGIELLRAAVGEYAYGVDDDDLAEVVIDRLRERDMKLAVAESCTGGLVGARITAVPGSSDVFVGGVVSYANSAKEGILGVSEDLLGARGAVSAEVAEAMARGVAAKLGADVAAAITGVAGPGGGSEEKPVGTVFTAILVNGEITVKKRRFPGHRDWVRRRAAQEALNLVRHSLET